MEEKGSYAIDIANGLAYIHSLNCIHRYPLFFSHSHVISSNSEILHAEIVSLIYRKSKPKYRISVWLVKRKHTKYNRMNEFQFDGKRRNKDRRSISWLSGLLLKYWHHINTIVLLISMPMESSYGKFSLMEQFRLVQWPINRSKKEYRYCDEWWNEKDQRSFKGTLRPEWPPNTPRDVIEVLSIYIFDLSFLFRPSVHVGLEMPLQDLNWMK